MREFQEPLVSVVTPVFNAAQFLPECIDSVRSQTLQEWELLLVDDGSTDASASIARHYADQDPARIRVLQHPGGRNRGKSRSRNLGIAAARGRYLAFLDADDAFLPDKLRHQAHLLGEHPEAVMAYGRTLYWHGWNTDVAHSTDAPSKLGVEPGRIYAPPELLVAQLRRPGVVPCLCALLATRSAVDAVGRFDNSLQDLFEDQVLIAKLNLSGRVWVDDAILERYRQHPGSSSAMAIAEGRYHPTQSNAARLVFLEWLQAHMAQSGLDGHGALRRALAVALRPYRYPRTDRLLGLPRSLLSRLRH